MALVSGTIKLDTRLNVMAFLRNVESMGAIGKKLFTVYLPTGGSKVMSGSEAYKLAKTREAYFTSQDAAYNTNEVNKYATNASAITAEAQRQAFIAHGTEGSSSIGGRCYFTTKKVTLFEGSTDSAAVLSLHFVMSATPNDYISNYSTVSRYIPGNTSRVSLLHGTVTRGGVIIGKYYVYLGAVTPSTTGGGSTSAGADTTQQGTNKNSNSGASSTGACAVGTGTVVVNTSLNVRDTPSTAGKVVGSLSNGTAVTITGCEGDWAKISSPAGYVNCKYIAVQAASTATAEAGTGGATATPSALPSSTDDTVWTSPIVKNIYDQGMSPDDDVLISSADQYTQELDVFDIPEGYTRAQFIAHVNEDNNWKSRRFEFIIGPSQQQLSMTNSVNPVKTGGGYVVLRTGPDMSRMALTGVFMNSQNADERRVFLESYYKRFLVDKVNAFNEYFNDSHIIIELEGMKYYCILTQFDLSRSAQSLFLYNFTMQFYCTFSEPIGEVATLGDAAAGALAPVASTKPPEMAPVQVMAALKETPSNTILPATKLTASQRAEFEGWNTAMSGGADVLTPAQKQKWTDYAIIIARGG